MDKLKQMLAKRKLEDKELIEASGCSKKYFKIGELEAIKNKNRPIPSGSTTAVPVDDKENSVAVSTSDVNNHNETIGEEKEKKTNLPRKEVVKKLREIGEPIRLFGESDYDVFMRLRELEMLNLEGDTKGYKNDFQDAIVKANEIRMNVIAKNDATIDDSLKIKVKLAEEGVTYEEIIEMSKNLNAQDKKLGGEVITKFFKLIMSHWADELNEKSAIKKQFLNVSESAIHVQTNDYLKPLFDRLKKQTLSEDIFSCLVDILKHLLDRNYIRAHEVYMELSIGNAPWPMGVTMVGIHARKGREKISSKNVAHVLNDETQRKYIQGLKRIMTKAQDIYPTDPSRCVNYARAQTQ